MSGKMRTRPTAVPMNCSRLCDMAEAKVSNKNTDNQEAPNKSLAESASVPMSLPGWHPDLARDAMRTMLEGPGRDDVLALRIDEFRNVLKTLERKVDEVTLRLRSGGSVN